MADGGEARCSYCSAAMSESVVLQKCSGCLKAMYCCREHQRLDWVFHRPFCQSILWRSVSVKHSSSACFGGPDDSRYDCRNAVWHPPLFNGYQRSKNIVVRVSEGSQPVSNPASVFSSGQKVVSDWCSDSMLSETDLVHRNKEFGGNMPWVIDHNLNKPLNVSRPVLTSVGDAKNAEVSWKRHVVLYMCEVLQHYGWGVLDGFFSYKLADDCLKEIKSLLRDGKFSEGRLSQEGRRSLKFRSDLICWYDGGTVACQNLSKLMSETDSLVISLSSCLSNVHIKGRSQAMISCYPGNASKYVKHVDNPGKDGRVLTVILYLNHDWNVSCGGALRLFPKSATSPMIIEPTFNRMLFFWSDLRNPHEVLPTFRER